MCSPARVALWCSRQGNSTSDGNGACGNLVHVLAGLGRETLVLSTSGEKASVDNGMRTTMVGPKLEDEPILSLHPWLLDDPMFKGTYVSDGVATR